MKWLLGRGVVIVGSSLAVVNHIRSSRPSDAKARGVRVCVSTLVTQDGPFVRVLGFSAAADQFCAWSPAKALAAAPSGLSEPSSTRPMQDARASTLAARHLGSRHVWAASQLQQTALSGSLAKTAVSPRDAAKSRSPLTKPDARTASALQQPSDPQQRNGVRRWT